MSQGERRTSTYDADAGALAALYESVSFETTHGWLLDLVPDRPGLVLDVGAGSGRDAAWFAERGHEVVAIEPSSGMRAEGGRLRSHPRLRWLDDRLPGLGTTVRLGLAFDLILVSAVWMHVRPDDRARAFRKLVTLLKPGGMLALTLRHGPAPPGRPMHPASVAEIEHLVRAHGGLVVRTGTTDDGLGRQGVSWSHVAVRLPDDGTGALPLLRHIILNEDKSSTYKLALLRALCRIADGAAGCVRDVDDDYVAVPLGLVGLTWNPILPERFRIEAAASLPIVEGSEFRLDDVFAGLEMSSPAWRCSGCGCGCGTISRCRSGSRRSSRRRP